MRPPTTRYSLNDAPPAVIIVLEHERGAPWIGTNAAAVDNWQALDEWICSHPSLQAIVEAAYAAQGDAEPSETPTDTNP